MLPLTNSSRHLRPAADFTASGEAQMLAWFPPAGARLTSLLSDSHSLVRLLGAGHSVNGTAGKVPTGGDVALRDSSGALVTRWEILWSRLDTCANNSLPVPILVLDNVPVAFCPPGKCDSPSDEGYGMNYDPHNFTEYAEWIESRAERAAWCSAGALDSM